MRVLLAVFSITLVGCNPHSNQWVLQSYDRDKGYIFVKDGVQYEATCFGIGRPMLGAPSNQTPDMDPDSMPPNIAHDQTNCGDILVYLHKPIPNFRQVGGSLLVFTEAENQNYKLEFEVKHAK